MTLEAGCGTLSLRRNTGHPPPGESKMNAMTATYTATLLDERRQRVSVPCVERRANRREQQAAQALAAQLRQVREHSYLSIGGPLFRIH